MNLKCNLSILIVAVSISSCEKFLEVKAPKSRIPSNLVFNSDVTANSAVIAMYATMLEPQNFSSGDLSSITMLAGLSSDELITRRFNDISTIEFSTNNLSVENEKVLTIWTSIYKVIYMANSAIEGLTASTFVSSSLKSQLIGEALFVRAFCHFYLVNLFGDVPLITSTDYRTNSVVSRNPKDQVYQQIITDLKKAKNLLADEYADKERTRPNKAAALSLLSRVYLYIGNWANAELEADSVINNLTKYSLVRLDSVFFKNSTEAIWQLRNGAVGYIGYTNEGYFFTPLIVLNNYILNPAIINFFEAADNRKNRWIGIYTIGDTIYYPYKYKHNSSTTITEYSMVLRLAEQYLIRAEARAQQDNIIGAKLDINVIRNRASLDNTTAGNKTELLAAIEKERRVELFTEWGHRWFDLKRTNRASDVLRPIKVKWNSGDLLYPIPQKELNSNARLLPQNFEY